MDYLEESQTKTDNRNRYSGAYDFWSRYIVWDKRTDKFNQTKTHEQTFNPASTPMFNEQPDSITGDLVATVSGFQTYGANPDGSDLTQSGNDGAINWSVYDLGTGDYYSVGAQPTARGPGTNGAKTSEWVGWLQAGLDVAGLIPVVGEFADLANAGIYLVQGDYAMAGCSLISVIPVVGDAIGKSGKIELKVGRYADEAADVSKLVAKKIDLPIIGCFVAGTLVHASALAATPWELALTSFAHEATREHEWLYGGDQCAAFESSHSEPTPIAIEDVVLGTRTLGGNPIREDYDASFAEPDAEQWRSVHMSLERDDGVMVDIQLLRPVDWLEAVGLTEGAEFHVTLPHTHATGVARVFEVGPCPSIAEGEGNVVIGRFETRNAHDLVIVTLDDGTSITGTCIHPVWSLDRLEWVELGQLKEGEVLLGIDGPVNVGRIKFLNASQPVYNLEILGEHVYCVGKLGVLSHNTGPGQNCSFIMKPQAPVKAANLPSIKKLTIDMVHVASGHMKGGSRVSSIKDLFPATWTKAQVEKAIKESYKTAKRIKTQGDRILIQGTFKDKTIEMWLNTVTKTIETAYPKGW